MLNLLAERQAVASKQWWWRLRRAICSTCWSTQPGQRYPRQRILVVRLLANVHWWPMSKPKSIC